MCLYLPFMIGLPLLYKVGMNLAQLTSSTPLKKLSYYTPTPLPITATSLQRPLSSEPKVAIVEIFDCTFRSLLCNLITDKSWGRGGGGSAWNPSPEFLICCTILKRFYSGKPLIFLTRWGISKGWWLCWRPVTSPTMVAILAFTKNKKSG